MESSLSYDSSNFVMSYLDIIPAIIMIVDEDVKIHNINRFTTEKFGFSALDKYLKKGGDAFHCINSFNKSGGCGKSEECKTCTIRNAVYQAFYESKSSRNYKRLAYRADESIFTLECLVTASPVIYEDMKRVVLIIEDIGELMTLRRLIPICAKCKKIRNDKNYWEEVDEYIHSQMQVDFSHGICPDCIREIYPEIAKQMGIEKKSSGEWT